MSIKYAKKRLIDSVWTLKYELLDDNKVKLISYDRNNPIGYEQEKSLDDCYLREKDGRTVFEIEVMDGRRFMSDPVKNLRKYDVVNPKHIFSYREE